MIEEIRSMIYDLCDKNDKSRANVWKNHIDSVIKYSLILAKEYEADAEIVEITAI